jgi:hypothetical protein
MNLADYAWVVATVGMLLLSLGAFLWDRWRR